MGIYDDIKTIVTITRTLEQQSFLIEKLEKDIDRLRGDFQSMKDRILVLEAREDAIVLLAREAATKAARDVLSNADGNDFKKMPLQLRDHTSESM